MGRGGFGAGSTPLASVAFLHSLLSLHNFGSNWKKILSDNCFQKADIRPFLMDGMKVLLL